MFVVIPLTSNFRFWPSVFLEVDVFYQLPPIHSGVYRGGGPHDLAIFRQHVLRRDNRFFSRICWGHARSASVLQELCKQIHTWHEVRVSDCQLAWFLLFIVHIPNNRCVFSRANAHERSPEFVLHRGIRNIGEHSRAPTLLNTPLVICVNPYTIHVSTLDFQNSILDFQLRKKLFCILNYMFWIILFFVTYMDI